MNKKKRPWKFRALTVVLVPLLLVGGAEVLLRVLLFSPLIKPHPCRPSLNHPQYLFMSDPETNYTLRPCFEGWEASLYGEFMAPVVINSLGLRAADVNTRICRPCQRVLILGDSFTFGEGVAYEDTFTARVEDQLQTNYGWRIQMFNGGVPSFSLGQMALRLKRLHGPLQPRLVVVCWLPMTFGREQNQGLQYLNGYLVPPNAIPRLQVVGDNIFQSSYPPGSRRARADLMLQSHFFFYYLLKNEAKLSLHRRVMHVFFTQPQDFNVPAPYLKKPLERIKAISDYCRDNGAGFGLVLLASNPATTDLISVFCKENNIPMISLASQLYTKNSPHQDLIFQIDHHFNPSGHAFITPPLAEFINSLLSELPPAP
jgi:hypothetical protein